MLSIHPEGLVVLWMSLECPGALQDLFCQCDFFSPKNGYFWASVGAKEASMLVNIHYYDVFITY